MIGMQVWSDETDGSLEHLDRHARDDPGTLDASACGHPMIAIKGSEQRRLAGTIAAMNDPALPGPDLK
jgi:hypothetical protein